MDVEDLDRYTRHILSAFAVNGLAAYLNERSEVHVRHEYAGGRLLVYITVYDPRALWHHEASCTVALDPGQR